MSERGAVYNRERATQVRDYTGLRFGNITPTDLDGLIEYKRAGYVLLEMKCEDATLPRGQELALERLTDDLQKVKPCILIISSHDALGDIDAANTKVRKFRFRGGWHMAEDGTTLGELVQRFLHWLELEHNVR